MKLKKQKLSTTARTTQTDKRTIGRSSAPSINLDQEYYEVRKAIADTQMLLLRGLHNNHVKSHRSGADAIVCMRQVSFQKEALAPSGL